MTAEPERVFVVALTEPERRYLLDHLEDVDELRAADLRRMLENALDPDEARSALGATSRLAHDFLR
jgi:hypothetical protein